MHTEATTAPASMQRRQGRRQRPVALVAHAGGAVQPAAARHDHQSRRLAERVGDLEGEAVGGAHRRGVLRRAHDARRKAGGDEDLQGRDGVEIVKPVEDDDLGEGKSVVFEHGRQS